MIDDNRYSARLSGKSYADFLREEVFLPLGMLRASVNVGPGLESYQAQRYGSDGVRYPFYDCDHPGASAVYCSAHDLMRFCMFHLKQPLPDQKAILSAEALDEMQAPTARQSALERRRLFIPLQKMRDGLEILFDRALGAILLV